MLHYFLSFEECPLRNAAILQLWLCDGDRVVFKVVEDDDFADSVILKCRLDDSFLEIPLESIMK